MKRKSVKAPQGAILVFFLVLMTILLLLATSALSFQGSVLRDASKNSSRQAATYLADSGLEKGFAAYLASSSYTGETLNLGNGTIVITIAAGSTANEKILSASATVLNLTRKVRTKLVTQPSTTAVAFNYALQAGTSGFTLGNGSQVTGNIYSNQNITGSNGATVTGSASAVGTISNLTVSGQKLTGQPVQPLPAFDQAFWKTKAQAGSTISGNYTPANNSTIGPLYVIGDINFGNGSTVTVAGPVYATGTVSFGNGAIIKVANILSPSGVMLIAEGTISIGNSFTVTPNAGGGDLLIISANISNNAISLGNGVTVVNAPLFTPNGGISIGNSAHAVAFAGKQISLGNNTVITYDSGLANESYTSGPGGAWTVLRGAYQEY